MFNLLRQSLHPVAHDRPAAGTRTRPLGAGFECLESRCLLSLAPPVAELFVPPNASQGLSILPYQPSGDGGHGGAWPDVPEQPQLPSEDWEEPSSEGGPIDIGDLDNSSPEVLNGAEDREKQAVLDLLLSLSVQPRSAAAEAVGLKEDLPHEIEYDVPVTGLPDANLERASNALLEGGMVALVPGASIVEWVAEQSTASDDTRSWLEAPVQMDSSYGRFQAFEVSTAERASPEAALPAAKRNGQPVPLNPTPDAPAQPHSEPTNEAHAEPNTADRQPDTDDEATAEEIPLSTELPCASDEKTIQSWHAAAIALFLAIVAGVRRRFVARHLEHGLRE